MTTATTYPAIPTLEPQRAGERPADFGLRAFRFLVSERVVAGLLDTDALELAMHASHGVVTAVEMNAEAREVMRGVRFDIATTLERRAREMPPAVSAPPPDDSRQPDGPRDGGHRVPLRRPVPIVPPAGASARPF
jgi:hypothetical protein